MRTYNILAVDDDLFMLNIIARLFYKHENIMVYKLYGSAGIFDYVKNINIDLIITDILMPDIKGLEIITTIKQSYNIPIIALSGSWDYVDIAKALGADVGLVKPFNNNELVDTALNLLKINNL